MSNETPATLSERELFAVFLNLTVKASTNFGAASIEDSYQPADYLHFSGEYGELDDVGEVILDRIIEDEQPGDYLRSLAASMECHAKEFRKVMQDFHAFKALHSAERDLGDEPDDQSSEAYKEWRASWDEHERNPRFRMPAQNEGEVGVMDWWKINRQMTDRRHRRNDAIADCVSAAGDDGYGDFALEYADFTDYVLAVNAGEIPSLIEYIDRFTRDFPRDREQVKRNLGAILAAL